MRTFGITLIEMLIAAVIGVAILTLIATSLRGSTDSIRFVQNSQMLTEDLRTAGNLISDYLSTASFVYPTGTVITLNSLSSYTVRNPITNTNTWRIGQDPAIALLQPPTVEGGVEVVKFVMIYPLNRGFVVGRALGAENPGPDPTNSDKWLLYIYERNIPVGASRLPNGLPAAIPTTIEGSSGNLLADYVQPGGFEVNFANCLGFDETGVATLAPCPSAPPSPLRAEHSTAQIRFSLQGEIRQGGRDSRVPANPLRFEVAPRNLPKRLTDITPN